MSGTMSLDMAAPLDPRVKKLLVIVSWRNDKRIHVLIEGVSDIGEVLHSGSARTGLTLWRTVFLPSLRLFASEAQIACEVVEKMGPRKK
jgi:hypothetical protein